MEMILEGLRTYVLLMGYLENCKNCVIHGEWRMANGFPFLNFLRNTFKQRAVQSVTFREESFKK
jgi:hypothetical protein